MPDPGRPKLNGVPSETADAPFLMCVEDVFRRPPGRAVLAAGRIERGSVRLGDAVQVVGPGADATVPVSAIEVGRLPLADAVAGMNAALLLSGSVAGFLRWGHVLAAPGTIGAHARFNADIALLPEEHGGTDLRTGDRLHVHLRTAAVPATVAFPRPTDVLHPSHQATVTLTLAHPIALEPGDRFAFRHRARAAGSGTVTATPDPLG